MGDQEPWVKFLIQGRSLSVSVPSQFVWSDAKRWNPLTSAPSNLFSFYPPHSDREGSDGLLQNAI